MEHFISHKFKDFTDVEHSQAQIFGVFFLENVI